MFSSGTEQIQFWRLNEYVQFWRLNFVSVGRGGGENRRRASTKARLAFENARRALVDSRLSFGPPLCLLGTLVQFSHPRHPHNRCPPPPSSRAARGCRRRRAFPEPSRRHPWPRGGAPSHHRPLRHPEPFTYLPSPTALSTAAVLALVW
jgi:hypothetical protein